MDNAWIWAKWDRHRPVSAGRLAGGAGKAFMPPRLTRPAPARGDASLEISPRGVALKRAKFSNDFDKRLST
jgi:hypothetical protein